MFNRQHVVLCIVMSCSAPIRAQTVSLVPGERPAWDAAATIGWFSGNKSELAEEWNDWYDAFAASAHIGRYFTPHLKTEAGATVTTDGIVYSQVAVPARTQPFPVFIPREHRFRLNALDVAAAYQFFDNQWVHPFVHAGVQLGWERERARAPLVGGRDAMTFDVRPFAGAGAKFYVNERGFLRTDLTVGWRSGGVAQVSWRTGVGVDF
jgi:hypothetical protein